MVEFGHKSDEKMKAMLKETKENIQGTNSDGKETGTQISGLEQKEEINIRPEQDEETRIQKNEERLRNCLLYTSPSPRDTYFNLYIVCLLYTSDAADDNSRV